MISEYDKIGSSSFKFVIAAEEDFSSQKTKVMDFLKNALKLAEVKNKKRFTLELWDSQNIDKIKKGLGIRL